ncbi:MAG TPA: GNAT family N-acetyltransferase [Bradyrhizobium sp.]|jgi:GNAT superfamily N-acetyltransferase|nr:GNAT family N-acetyltransferase [Bradyrhizobium sp.]
MTPEIRPEIRQGRADDADFIARTILLAQRGPVPRGWFDIALAQAEPQVLDFIRRLAVAKQRSWWHASQFWIAEVEGRPAAALCAMPSRGSLAMARPAIEEAARESGMSSSDLAAMFARGAYTNNCWIQGGDEDWLIEHVASQPAYRGRALMQALIAHALAAGQAAGFSRASITFVIGNDAAERCYAKAGFTFAEEKRDANFEALTGTPGFRRFWRAI